MNTKLRPRKAFCPVVSSDFMTRSGLLKLKGFDGARCCQAGAGLPAPENKPMNDLYGVEMQQQNGRYRLREFVYRTRSEAELAAVNVGVNNDTATRV